MKTDAYNLFKSLFLILDKMWEENQDEELRIYLSDADPMFCENGTSSDPAVFEEFEKMYNEKKTEDLSDYSFIVYYLEHLDSFYGDIKKFFVRISEEDFDKQKA